MVVSGLLTDEQNEQLAEAGKTVVEKDTKKGSFYFQVTERGIMIAGPSNPDLVSEPLKSQVIQAFRTAALRSKIPHVAAELMGLDPKNEEEETVQVLRDLFLGKSVEETKTCGWHVDDLSYWPEAYTSSPKADGINAWIAMQDMPADYGGNLGVAPGTHVADWRWDAYSSIGLDRSKEGYTKEQVYKQVKDHGFKACSLDVEAPELSKRMDEGAHVPDLKCGDVIFHTRWLFHKTVPLTDEGRAHYRNQGLDCLNRYSVRYVPGTARLPTTFVNELSILSDPTNAGKQVKDVEDAWYPTVWPHLENDIDTKLRDLALGRIPDATQTLKSNLNELLTLLNTD